jgi:hypothetical protein
MAKAATKAPAKAKKAAAPKRNPNQLIEDACVASLAKLQELELDYQLQSEINWCLGSYRNDGNPVGLYLMAERALAIFKTAMSSKRKGIPAKLVKDIQVALKAR